MRETFPNEIACMKNNISDVQKQIKVGTHGEDYGSWMSNPVFYIFGGIALVLTVLSFAVFRIAALGVMFATATVILLALLGCVFRVCK